MRELTSAEIDAAVENVTACSRRDAFDEAWEAAGWLRDAVLQRNAALALLHLVGQHAFALERRFEVVQTVFDAHPDDAPILGRLGSRLEDALDRHFLNAAPPDDPVVQGVAERLRERAPSVRGTDVELAVVRGLATSARLLGRAWDGDAERGYGRLLELRPDDWQEQYDAGLFYKVRGRFADGLAANQRAAEFGGADDDSVRWNLGICATGARDARAALDIWKGFGHKIEIGRYGLPDGKYHGVKVRLAERPLAERTADDDEPGLEESVWIERVSPCHGIVRSALYQDLGVDFGDVVLFDGAPITHHKYGDDDVPVFPHLATLERPGYLILPFVATQPSEGVVAKLSRELPDDAVLYVHTEQFVTMCESCWADAKLDHAKHRKAEHRVVRGKLCAPPELDPRELRRVLDGLVGTAATVRLYVPDLSRMIGDDDRADVESRRMAMIPNGEEEET